MMLDPVQEFMAEDLSVAQSPHPQPPVVPTKNERKAIAKSNAKAVAVLVYLKATLAATVCYVVEKAFGLSLNYFVVLLIISAVALGAIWLYFFIDSNRP